MTPTTPNEMFERARRRVRHLRRVAACVQWARIAAKYEGSAEGAERPVAEAAHACAIILDALAGGGGPGLGCLVVEAPGLGVVAGGGMASTPWHHDWASEGMGSGRRHAVDGGAWEAALAGAGRPRRSLRPQRGGEPAPRGRARGRGRGPAAARRGAVDSLERLPACPGLGARHRHRPGRRRRGGPRRGPMPHPPGGALGAGALSRPRAGPGPGPRRPLDLHVGAAPGPPRGPGGNPSPGLYTYM